MKLSAILAYDGCGCNLNGDSDFGPVHLCVEVMRKLFPKTDFQPNVDYLLTVSKAKRVGAKSVTLDDTGAYPRWVTQSGTGEEEMGLNYFLGISDETIRKLVSLLGARMVSAKSLVIEIWVTCKKISK